MHVNHIILLGYDFRKDAGGSFFSLRRHPDAIGKPLQVRFRNSGDEDSELAVDLILFYKTNRNKVFINLKK